MVLRVAMNCFSMKEIITIESLEVGQNGLNIKDDWLSSKTLCIPLRQASHASVPLEIRLQSNLSSNPTAKEHKAHQNHIHAKDQFR